MLITCVVPSVACNAQGLNQKHFKKVMALHVLRLRLVFLLALHKATLPVSRLPCPVIEDQRDSAESLTKMPLSRIRQHSSRTLSPSFKAPSLAGSSVSSQTGVGFSGAYRGDIDSRIDREGPSARECFVLVWFVRFSY